MILDGKKVADVIKESLKARIAALAAAVRHSPLLVVIQVGDNAESTSFIERKKKFGEAVGARVQCIRLPISITEKELFEKVQEISRDQNTGGLIVQLPLPSTCRASYIMDAIDPTKDADGLSSVNSAALGRAHSASEKGSFVTPATARGIARLLDAYSINPEGKHVLIIGRSNLVGKPIALTMLARNATVTVCHSHSGDLLRYTKSADIIISATGKADLLRAEHVREGQVLIDVGITHSKDGHLSGDIAFDEVVNTVAAISPVPGGVGPLTVACLFENLVDLFEQKHKS